MLGMLPKPSWLNRRAVWSTPTLVQLIAPSRPGQASAIHQPCLPRANALSIPQATASRLREASQVEVGMSS